MESVKGDYTSQEDAFIYRYIPDSIDRVMYAGLLIEQVDETFLHEISNVVGIVTIERFKKN